MEQSSAAPDRQRSGNFTPLILVAGRSLILSDTHMAKKTHVFEERAQEGWQGNGYDWTSLARVAIAEQLPHLQSSIRFDPEAGMFSAQGPTEALEELGKLMQGIFESDAQIRDLLSRAVLD